MNNRKRWIITTIVIVVITLIISIVGVIAIRGRAGRFNRLLDLGQTYLDDGDYERALAAFEDAWKIDPKNPGLYELIGEAYARKNAPLEAIDMFVYFDAAFGEPSHDLLIEEIRNRISDGTYREETNGLPQPDDFYNEIMDYLKKVIEDKGDEVPDLQKKDADDKKADDESENSFTDEERKSDEEDNKQNNMQDDVNAYDGLTLNNFEEVRGSHAGAMKLYETVRSAYGYKVFGKSIADWDRESMISYGRANGTDVRGDGNLLDMGDRLVNYTPANGGMTVVFYPADQVDYSCSAAYFDGYSVLGTNVKPSRTDEYPLLGITYESLFEECGARDVMELALEYPNELTGSDPSILFYDLGDGMKMLITYYVDNDRYHIMTTDSTGREIEVFSSSGNKGVISYVMYDNSSIKTYMSASGIHFIKVVP